MKRHKFCHKAMTTEDVENDEDEDMEKVFEEEEDSMPIIDNIIEFMESPFEEEVVKIEKKSSLHNKFFLQLMGGSSKKSMYLISSLTIIPNNAYLSEI